MSTRRPPPVDYLDDAYQQILILHDTLTAAGMPCSLTTTPAVTLLIGTPGGGVITIGLTGRPPGWWATGATGADLTPRRGQHLTAVIDAELARRTRDADAQYRADIYQRTTWPTTTAAGE